MNVEKAQVRRTGGAARAFGEFEHRTKSQSGSRKRHVVAEAEQIEGKGKPRFGVTNLNRQV